jgi:hypothetical protein
MRFELRERRPADLREWLALLAALLLIGAGLGALHLCGVSLCVFRRLTGLPCLTCGASRAVALALRGDVPGALAQQPLAMVAAALAGAGLTAYSILLVGLRRVARVKVAPREGRLLWAAGLALAALNWIYLVRSGV